MFEPHKGMSDEGGSDEPRNGAATEFDNNEVPVLLLSCAVNGLLQQLRLLHTMARGKLRSWTVYGNMLQRL